MSQLTVRNVPVRAGALASMSQPATVVSLVGQPAALLPALAPTTGTVAGSWTGLPGLPMQLAHEPGVGGMSVDPRLVAGLPALVPAVGAELAPGQAEKLVAQLEGLVAQGLAGDTGTRGNQKLERMGRGVVTLLDGDHNQRCERDNVPRDAAREVANQTRGVTDPRQLVDRFTGGLGAVAPRLPLHMDIHAFVMAVLRESYMHYSNLLRDFGNTLDGINKRREDLRLRVNQLRGFLRSAGEGAALPADLAWVAELFEQGSGGGNANGQDASGAGTGAQTEASGGQRTSGGTATAATTDSDPGPDAGQNGTGSPPDAPSTDGVTLDARRPPSAAVLATAGFVPHALIAFPVDGWLSSFDWYAPLAYAEDATAPGRRALAASFPTFVHLSPIDTEELLSGLAARAEGRDPKSPVATLLNEAVSAMSATQLAAFKFIHPRLFIDLDKVVEADLAKRVADLGPGLTKMPESFADSPRVAECFSLAVEWKRANPDGAPSQSALFEALGTRLATLEPDEARAFMDAVWQVSPLCALSDAEKAAVFFQLGASAFADGDLGAWDFVRRLGSAPSAFLDAWAAQDNGLRAAAGFKGKLPGTPIADLEQVTLGKQAFADRPGSRGVAKYAPVVQPQGPSGAPSEPPAASTGATDVGADDSGTPGTSSTSVTPSASDTPPVQGEPASVGETTQQHQGLGAAASKPITREALEQLVKDLETELELTGTDQQMAAADVQNALQQQQQALQLMSNMSKMLHDVAMAIIRNIGG